MSNRKGNRKKFEISKTSMYVMDCWDIYFIFCNSPRLTTDHYTYFRRKTKSTANLFPYKYYVNLIASTSCRTFYNRCNRITAIVIVILLCFGTIKMSESSRSSKAKYTWLYYVLYYIMPVLV